MTTENRSVTLLDYGAGNVRSIRNAITRLGWSIIDVEKPEDITNAERLIFPGVGSFAAAMENLTLKGFVEPLKTYISSGRPFFGICIGMQVLFDWSEEGDAAGLGIIPGRVERFTCQLAIPHIGWNSLSLYPPHSSPSTSTASSPPSLFSGLPSERFYFVHSYRALPTSSNLPFIRTLTDYGERFISTVQRGHLLATQFHPEKSGDAGLRVIRHFLESSLSATPSSVSHSSLLIQHEAKTPLPDEEKSASPPTSLSKRIIACLDVRSNDQGDLVVTKGDQYDVRESHTDGKGAVRNLGKPVELARAYYEQGADEVTFLNITSFRGEVLGDLPLLDVLKRTSETVFVPLCVGGGIRDYVDKEGKVWSALRVAEEYFRSGADKVSIGSDAVLAAEEWWKEGKKGTGKSCIEQISRVYGAQAVVVSIDPRRVYVESPADTRHDVIETTADPTTGWRYCWYQCTIKGGREGRDVDVIQLVKAVEDLGAGELLLNCMDMDGRKGGYDIELINWVMRETRLPVIASSGAGRVEHFSAVFNETGVQAALAAGIFHRKEVPIAEVKEHLREVGIPVRLE